jgi:uncharacterized membrane protein YfcA
LRDVLTLAAGVATGVLSGAFGVGGAVISTPSLRALGLPAILAVGTTLPSILPSAVAGTLRYRREGLIDLRTVAWTAPFGVAASVGGSALAHVLPGEGHIPMILTALLLAFTAWRMIKTPKQSATDGAVETRAPDAPPPRRHDRPAVLAPIGIGAGLMSGLLGIGGGVVMVPAFTELARIPLKRAIATSLACVGLFAIPGTLTHWALGGIDWWPWAILVSVGVVPGARLGASLAVKAADANLRRAVGVFLSIIAVIYFAGELLALI